MKATQSTYLLLISPLILVSIPSWRADAQTASGAARDFLAGAQTVYQTGLDICAGACEPELAQPLANLGATLGPLTSAIDSGDDQQIRSAITNTAATLSGICTALRVDCPVPAFGAENPSSKQTLKGETAPAAMGECFNQCERSVRDCDNAAISQQNTCNARINEYAGCRLKTPYCDWQAAPFDATGYAACRSFAYYRQFLQECRCPFPPGQAERQGGCPAFFTQATGDISTGACEVPDGLGCARCCFAKCQGADSRPSCQGGNREECDVCEWSRRTLLAGQSMRTSLCQAPVWGALAVCEGMYTACIERCSLFE